MCNRGWPETNLLFSQIWFRLSVVSPPSGQDRVLQTVCPNVSTQEENGIQYQQQSGTLACVCLSVSDIKAAFVASASSFDFHRNRYGARTAQQSQRYKALVISWFYKLLTLEHFLWKWRFSTKLQFDRGSSIRPSYSCPIRRSENCFLLEGTLIWNHHIGFIYSYRPVISPAKVDHTTKWTK